MKPTILVIGATGNVGREVVKSLTSANVPCRIGVRDPEKVERQFEEGVEVVGFDFLVPETFDQTFTGIKKVFLVRPPQLADVENQIKPALLHAVKAGVKRIVFLSLQGVEKASITPHHKIEKLIESLKVDHTFLRAGFFMQNLSTTHLAEIRDTGRITVPVGKARTSFIDVRDIGAVGAEVLIHDTHHNKAYTLTGLEALTYDEVAEILSDVVGKDIRYTNPNPIGFFLRQWRETGKFSYAIVVTGLYTATRLGNAAAISHDLQDILKRDPITFRQFAEEHRAYWLS